ncbi:MAG: OmpA family protein [Myxococcales bacterium]|nr:OmpA family protein [Myxococcales bacterium]
MAAALALGLLACGGAQEGVDNRSLSDMQAPTEAAQAQPETEAVPGDGPDDAVLTVSAFQIDPTFGERCGPEALPSPMFPYDSANPTPEAEARLEQLARCLTEGPLADARVQLIGRADPLGDGEYNMQLGRDRARSVAYLLIERGVDPERIDVLSRGERAASGRPVEWAMDRRVDVHVLLEDRDA